MLCEVEGGQRGDLSQLAPSKCVEAALFPFLARSILLNPDSRHVGDLSYQTKAYFFCLLDNRSAHTSSQLHTG